MIFLYRYHSRQFIYNTFPIGRFLLVLIIALPLRINVKKILNISNFGRFIESDVLPMKKKRLVMLPTRQLCPNSPNRYLYLTKYFTCSTILYSVHYWVSIVLQLKALLGVISTVSMFSEVSISCLCPSLVIETRDVITSFSPKKKMRHF